MKNQNQPSTPHTYTYCVMFPYRKRFYQLFFSNTQEVENRLSRLGTIRDYWRCEDDIYSIEIETKEAERLIVMLTIIRGTNN